MMGDFYSLERASELADISTKKLINLAMEDKISIYALGDWFCCFMEEPEKRINVRKPFVIDDQTHLYKLERGETSILYIDNYGRSIFPRSAEGNEYLIGVSINQSNLYCLKSEVEGLKNNFASSDANTIKQQVEQDRCSNVNLIPKRKDNLRRAIDIVILKYGKKPSLDELWKYLCDLCDRHETEIIVDHTDTHITWMDTKGIYHDIDKRTLANRLSRVRY